MSKNAVHYHSSFSFDLAAISNIDTTAIFWCNWKSILLKRDGLYNQVFAI